MNDEIDDTVVDPISGGYPYLSRDVELRECALNLAIRAKDANSDVLKDAQNFYNFLKGQN